MKKRLVLSLLVSIFFLLVFVPLSITEASCANPANEIVTENCETGNDPSEWEITGIGDPSIQGYATTLSVNIGETVEFKIDTPSTNYKVDIYRLGYYGGLGARLLDTIQPSATLPQAQPTCITDPALGLVDCGNWNVSASWQVPNSAVSGIYLAKPSREDATSQGSHIIFIVRDDNGESDILFQTSDTTWQAYNSYGGSSIYSGGPGTSPNRAYAVSYNRPFITRIVDGGADWVFNAEYPMLRWIERNGYDVSYFTGIDSDVRGAEILEHNLFLSVGHDEYWSAAQRANVEAARDNASDPVNLAFFSGNEVFWKTRWEAGIGGTVSNPRTLISYKETHNDANIDGLDVWTGTWRDPRFSPPGDGGNPENSLTGQMFTVNCCSYTLSVPAAFGNLRFWRNTSVASAAPNTSVTMTADTIGYEWDEALVNGAQPDGLVRLSSQTENVAQRIQDFGSSYAPGTATHAMTMYRASSGALVFGAGTVQWSWGLDSNHDRGNAPANVDMQQATVNLFADMGVQPYTLQTELVAATASTDTIAPTATIATPLNAATVQSNSNVTISGTALDTGGVVGIVEVSTDGNTWFPATGRANWTYNWVPTATGNFTLTARATDDSGNIGVVSAPISVTVEARVCPCSIWGDFPNVGPSDGDTAAIEVGLKFRSTEAGFITGIRFYKHTNATGLFVGRLWSSTGTLLTAVNFVNVTASGWQEATLQQAVPVLPNVTYIVTYHTPTGGYAASNGFFANQSVTAEPLVALQEGIDGANGVYRYGSGGVFPTDTYQSANYWVDVVFNETADPDTAAPTVLSVSPVNNAPSVNVNANVTATFSEAMEALSLNASSVELRDNSNNLVATTLTYNPNNFTVTLDPITTLAHETTYTARIISGVFGVKDLATNALASDFAWSFTTSAPPPPPPDEGTGGPILVLSAATNPFSRYYAEILRAEGMTYFTASDISNVNATMLADYDVVILGEMSLSAAEVTLFSDWVNAGGNLIAMRPDAQLATLLGITPTGNQLSAPRGYLLVDTANGAGVGIFNQTMQIHGAADLYTFNGASAVATLYANATTATTNPAVTLVSVGANGGQAAAFTYDLARSIVYTRQGNPEWSGQERDGQSGPIRSDDLFFGNASGDSQPDWIDLNKVAIPQADEQQRLLANLITQMNADQLPLPRFWYFPRGGKAVVVMTGDDHGSSTGVPDRLNRYIDLSPVGCSVTEWECVRASAYLYPNTGLQDFQAVNYNNLGFEIGIHLNTGCANWTPTSLANDYTNQLAQFAARFVTLPAQVTHRTHCIAWSDWSSQATIQQQNSIRLDTNYYYWPASWVQDRPGFMTGSGMPMRFADLNGTMIDVYQAHTHMTDESGQSYPATAATLLDRALGAEGYYGAFTANIHYDGNGAQFAPSEGIIAAAQARDVPVISARQLLEWTDGRNGSSFNNMAWNTNTLTFSVSVGANANGLQALLPASANGSALQTLTRDGNAVSFTVETMKGIQYARFNAAAGAYTALYMADTTAPTITARTPAPSAIDVAVASNVTVTFSEPMNIASLSSANVRLRANGAGNDVDAALSYDSGSNRVTLNPTANLTNNTLYTVTVASAVADANGNTFGTDATWSFTTLALATCPCSIWNNTPNVGAFFAEAADYELGVKFRSSEAGFISHLKFYWYPGMNGPFVGHLWSETGTLLAQQTFATPTGNAGWQQVALTTPIVVTANFVYVASTSLAGGYPFSGAYFTNNGVDSGPLRALSASESPNGVVNETANSFPNLTFNNANYWIDVIFTNQAPDSVAPLITLLGDTTVNLTVGASYTDAGATALDNVDGNITANIVVTGSVNTNIAGTYTLTYNVSDLAGNAATPVVRTVIVGAAPCPCSIWGNTVPNIGNGDSETYELGTKFTSAENGYITGVRFYKNSLDVTPSRTGRLWNATTQQLLGQVTFTESASGWQEANFATPIAITANTLYIVSYNTTGGYSFTPAFFNTAVVSGFLRAPATQETPNGVFNETQGLLPNSTFNANNYWADVLFTTELPADTTAPVISAIVATPTMTSATITWMTDEAATSLVEYGTDANTLTSTVSDNALMTSHSLTLNDLTAGTTYYYRVTSADAATNSATSPATPASPLALTTLPLSVGDSTSADFNAGTPGGCAVWEISDGSVLLAPTVGSDFAGTTLPVGWSEFVWNAGGTSTFAGGNLTVNGTRFSADTFYTTGKVLEFVATFNGASFQNIGLGQTYETGNEFWLNFGTANTTNTLFARTNLDNTQIDTPIPGNWLGTPHTYRIEWLANEARFYIDGVLRHTQSATITAELRPLISDFDSASPALVVDWLRVTPFAENCTFTSRVLDTNSAAQWTTVTWQESVPTGTALSISVRTGNTPTPDSSWTTFAPVTNGGSVGRPSRYIQYQADLSTTEPSVTPVLESISFAYTILALPTATNDSYSAAEDTALSEAAPAIFANDSGITLSVTSNTNPANGTLTLNTDGSFVYTPNANYVGTDSFDYAAQDAFGRGINATVNLTVTAVNDAPVGTVDSYSVDEDSTLSIATTGVLSNDSDVENNPLTTTLVNTTVNGILVLNTDGSFTYTPNANFNGTDSFTYLANDGTADSAETSVTLTVNAVNDVAVAVADSYLTEEDVPLNITVALGVLSNDGDVDAGTTLTAILVGTTTNGTLTFNADGSFTYTPSLNYNGTDSFTYKANDGAADSDVVTVTLEITPVNNAPLAVADSYETAEDTPLNIAATGVLGNDTDVDTNTTLTAILVSTTTNGILTLNSDGSFSYTPYANFNGTDSFTYKANDGQDDSNTVIVSLTISTFNDAPIADNDDYSTNEDAELVVTAALGVLNGDSDVENNALTATLVSTTTNGTLTFDPDGSFTYDPNANTNGTDTFTYKVTDGTSDSNIATVTLTISATNDAPVAVTDSYTTDEDTLLDVDPTGVLGNDSDVDAGTTLIAVLVTNAQHGALILSPDGSFLYAPDAHYNGTDSFTYKANDSLADSDVTTVTITVNAVNDMPIANTDAYSTDEDTTLTVPASGILGNDTDSDTGTTLSGALVSDVAHGTLTLNSDGSFSYTPNANFNGTDSFTYKANDGTVDSNVATVTLTINSVNDAHIAKHDSYGMSEDTPLTVPATGVLGNDTNPDNDVLSAVLVNNSTYGTALLNADGSFTYAPNANFNGTDSFTYKVNDGTSDSNVATVTINVTAVNDAPIANDDSTNTNEDLPLVIAASGILANDTDLDGGTAITAMLISTTTSGTLTLNADGSFTYVPNANFYGQDTFTYQAVANSLTSNTATVTITVAPVNDAPIAGNDNYGTNEDTPLFIAASGLLGNDSDLDSVGLSAILVSGTSNGSLSVFSNGSFSYTPNANFNGTDSFTYKANDGAADSNVATVNLVIGAVNDAPTADNDSYGVVEGLSLVVGAPGVLDGDSDIESGTAQLATLVSSPTNGAFAFYADGSFSYTPNIGFYGPDVFTYTASDGVAASNVATVTLLVTPNIAPTANADSYSTNEDTPLFIAAAGVLIGDTDAENNALSAILVSNATHGTASLNSDGSFSYSPNANYNGTDSFTYKVNDGLLDSNTATVTITVNAVNDAPTADNDTYNTNEDTALYETAIGVLNGDDDVDGNALTASLVSGTSNGSLTLNADGSFSYVPAPNFNGVDSFTYSANDGAATSNIATVTITVNAVNDKPVATDEAYATSEDTPLSIAAMGVLNGDTDIDSASLVAVLVSNPTNGTVNLSADGSFTYTPNANFNGADGFTYKANDGTADSNVATVNISVSAVNDTPTADDDSYITDEDTTLVISAIGVLNGDADADGNALSAILVSNPTSGNVTLNSDGSFNYTPNTNFNGTDSFTYKANDGLDDSNVATVTITVNAVNDAPTADDDSYTTDEDTALVVIAIGVLNGDADGDGNALSAVLVSNPTNGNVTLNSDGSFTYTPFTNFNGTDSFTYKANDGTADSNVAIVTITVNAVNDAPTADDDSYTTDEDTPLVVAAIGVLDGDTDSDSASLTAVLVSSTTNGTVTLNSNGSFIYTPDANFNGTDSFTYKANDGSADSNMATVTITVNAVNDAPIADNDSYTTDEDTMLTVSITGVLNGDADSDSASLTAVLVSSTTNGTVTLNSDGSFTYTPNANFNGTDSFTYKANDGSADSNVATVNISVTSMNDVPTTDNESYTTAEDTALVVAAIGVLDGDADVDGNALTAVIVNSAQYGTVNLSADGSFTYTPNTNFNGTDSFTYKANDGSADSNVATVNISVSAVNDTPILTAIGNRLVNELQTLMVNVVGTDVDGTALTLTVSPLPSFATFQDNGGGLGVLTLAPNATHQGVYTFTATVSDGIVSDTKTFTVTVVDVPSVNGLNATYYNNINLSGLPVVTRIDPTINFNSGTNSPAAPTVNRNNFSVRWTGQVEPVLTQAYTFSTLSDDGVRLWVNGQLVISNWTEHSAKENISKPLLLQAGQRYNVVLEYYERTGQSVIRLSWQSSSQVKQVIPQNRLFPTTGPIIQPTNGLRGTYFNNINLTGSPVLTRTDAMIDFNSGSGSPAVPTVTNDNFSVRWIGKVEPAFTQAYRFYTISDDGVRVWVNGQLVINNWTVHSATENVSAPILLQAGQRYDIVVEYYERTGQSVIRLSWQSASQPKQVIPQNRLYPPAS